MGDVVICAETVGKKYVIGRALDRNPTLRAAIMHRARELTRGVSGLVGSRARDQVRESHFWALEDVSFEVRRGEAVGIIGRNGAGKSTLLKILSRIVDPTVGRIVVRGRLGSLLEVGTGFHPELTGRENIYLNGAVLGMRRAEISKKFDEIVDFSAVKRFLDIPVKHYSTGMYLRLAFSVAAHLEPEILLVDEVLAVGDVEFQRKCLGKMTEIGRDGRTVLFVSHNLSAVQTFCKRVVWLDGGRIRKIGPSEEVVSEYVRSNVQTNSIRVWKDVETAPGTEIIRLHSVRAYPTTGFPGDPLTIDQGIVVDVDYWIFVPHPKFVLWLRLTNEHGVVVFDSRSIDVPDHLVVGRYRAKCVIPANFLNSGLHFFGIRAMDMAATSMLFEEEHCIAAVLNDSASLRGDFWGRWTGAVRPQLVWTHEVLEERRPVFERPLV